MTMTFLDEDPGEPEYAKTPTDDDHARAMAVHVDAEVVVRGIIVPVDQWNPWAEWEGSGYVG